MTDNQWDILVKTIEGELITPLPMGFIIDSPWLPNWYGIKILDYFTSDELWLKANFKAIERFPEIIFLPGFWSEYGMCTEPSAFGSKCNFPENEFPHANKLINSPEEIKLLKTPNPETDGLLPLVLNRLKLAQPIIEERGHKVRFAVSRGPLNIASYLMGTTEFLSLMMMKPDDVHSLLSKITEFIDNWIILQKETFPSIDGLFILDDIIGFMGPEEFLLFGVPYFKELFNKKVKVKFLHNDAQCNTSLPFLNEIGVNLFNMGYELGLNEIKDLTRNEVTLLGNLPPRDVLSNGSAESVKFETEKLLRSLNNYSKVIISCGGGMPPGVSSQNINAFISAVKEFRI